ncbi:peptide chain release factor N(5)-glutamine methyltransferase [Buchnera aphidicola]|uniref:peptide chain release factor N(5)-glutamine methyltransferase n=1 Tax=Buchnera aphidicola (Sarucallis kahawaluokalani) TaxID=1241878 RepID=A0A4D6YLT3_9GAMM|nr:peptide chain release factor N(5)-glutamine methyltransferase [Buchnera aphidicola]QCI25925.1 peptide chain release factor N(5)-glutamine methyltransferase [Buchnera aphidicola (Sarucallis kahawaluokalani)]
MNINFWIKYGVRFLSKVQTPTLDTELLISYVIQKSRTWINIFDNYILDYKQTVFLKKLLLRRLLGEPVAYIMHKKEFWSLSFYVSKYTLIPRPETEILVQNSLIRINHGDYVLDLGTGCGAISLAIAYEKPNCKVIGIDCVHQAVSIAKKNSKNLNITNVNFFYSNWFSCINQKFNLIVSNPPYLSKYEKFTLSKELFFEPPVALFSSNNGFSAIDYIINHSKKYLELQGWLLIEHGWKQKKLVYQLFQKSCFSNIYSYKDPLGYYRITVGQKLY